MKNTLLTIVLLASSPVAFAAEFSFGCTWVTLLIAVLSLIVNLILIWRLFFMKKRLESDRVLKKAKKNNKEGRTARSLAEEKYRPEVSEIMKQMKPLNLLNGGANKDK